MDTEDIAVRARQLAPLAFSWRKYPDQIDLDGVRVALYDAAKGKYGALVEGSVRTGWSLTQAGVDWEKRNGRFIRAQLARGPGPGRRDEQRAETRKRALERGRIRKLAAWRLWSAGRPVAARPAGAVFRVDSETPQRDVHLKVQRILEILGDDESFGPFLQEMARVVMDGVPSRHQPGNTRRGASRDG